MNFKKGDIVHVVSGEYAITLPGSWGEVIKTHPEYGIVLVCFHHLVGEDDGDCDNFEIASIDLQLEQVIESPLWKALS